MCIVTVRWKNKWASQVKSNCTDRVTIKGSGILKTLVNIRASIPVCASHVALTLHLSHRAEHPFL